MITRLAVALVASATLLAGAYSLGRVHGGQRVHAKWDKERTIQVEQAAAAEREFRRIEQDRARVAQEAINEATRKLAAARRDAAAAARAADGLRDAARAAAGSCAARDPAPAGSSPADRLADVLVAMEQEGRDLAASLDSAIIAGHACEQFVDQLRRTQP